MISRNILRKNQFKNIIFLTLCLMIAMFLNWALQPFVILIFKIPIHEMGHALMAWLGGKWAFPVFVAGFTFIGQNRSALIIGLSLFFYILSFFWFYKNRNFFLLSVTLILFSLFVKFTFRISEIKLEQYIALAGLLGEIVLPTIGLAIYFFDLKDIPHWNFWKYFVAFYCTVALYDSGLMWLRILDNLQNLPFGSALSSNGASDSSGDLNRLVSAGWTNPQITHFYISSFKICLMVILICMIFSFMIDTNEENRN